MLNNLRILNGSITPEFNSSIYDYEVVVDDTAISLLIDYDVSENYTVTIYGNDEFAIGENHVLLEVYDGNKVVSYNFKVMKESSQTAFMPIEETFKVNEYEPNQTILIGCTILFCILSISIIYILIFKVGSKDY